MQARKRAAMKITNDGYESKHDEAMAMCPPDRPTEGVVGPVTMTVRRQWPYDKRPADGTWFAGLDIGPCQGVFRCDHAHADVDDAWRCAETALQLLVIEHVNPEDYTW